MWILSVAAVAGLCQQLPADEAADQRIHQRLLESLRQQPRDGAVLDRIVSFHRTHNSLQTLREALRSEARNDAEDGRTWMLLGLLELHLGRSAEAVEALRQAEQRRPEDPFALWYLGRALAMTNASQEAATLLERALAANPDHRHQLEIARELGRLYHRLRQPERALQLWKRIEQEFPDDVRVREQIAAAMESDGQFSEALMRYRQLAELTDDPVRSIQFSLQAVEMRLRLHQQQQALADLESLLQQLRPGSWLHQEVRARIEDVFLRVSDRSALVAYYQHWLIQNPDDLEAALRLASTLAAQGNSEQAILLYQQQLDRFPGDLRIRHALIGELTRAGDLTAALEQHQKIHQLAPQDPDNIVDWGKLYLRDRSLPLEERRQRAAGIWRMMVHIQPENSAIIARTGDLHWQAGLRDEAIELYRQAVQLAPAELWLRESLGQYLHAAGKSDEALAVWQTLADEAFRSVSTLIRLADILLQYDFRQHALDAVTHALDSHPDFSERLRLSELLSQLDQDALAYEQLNLAAQQTASDVQQQTVDDRLVQFWSRQGTLETKIAKLQAELQNGSDVSGGRWRRLASMQLAADRPADALHSLSRAVAQQPQSVDLLMSMAELLEQLEQRQESVQAYGELMRIHPNLADVCLQRLMLLHRQLDQPDRAIESGQHLLTLYPERLDYYLMVAGLSADLGHHPSAVSILQQARQRFPADHKALLALAEVLAAQGQSESAIEFSWQAFDHALTLDIRREVTARLAELYLSINRFDQLIQQLTARSSEPNQQRSLAFSLSAAWMAAGSSEAARDALRTLLTEETRDLELLRQLSLLYEQDGLPMDSAGYQRRINQLAPSAAGSSRLASLLLRAGSDFERSGNRQQAAEAYLQALQDDPERFATNLETHLQSFEFLGRLPDLARMIRIVGLAPFHDMAPQLIHLGALAARNDAADQPGTVLVFSALDEFPEQRLSLLILARRLHMLNEDEFSQRLRVVLDVREQPMQVERIWWPWRSTDSWDAAALIELPLVLDSDIMVKELQSAVQEQMNVESAWQGGRLLIALLEAVRNQPEHCTELLRLLLDDAALRQPLPAIPDDVVLRSVAFLQRCPGIHESQQILLLEACLRQRSAADRDSDDPIVYKLRNLYLSTGQPDRLLP